MITSFIIHDRGPHYCAFAGPSAGVFYTDTESGETRSGIFHSADQQLSPPTVKQHLAALQMLFDWLVTGHVIDVNPAHAVRGPKYVVEKGKTPVLTADEARALLDGIPITNGFLKSSWTAIGL
jgi:site-specific recombinase XerC